MRLDGDEKWVFVAHKPPLQRLDHTDSQPITLRMRGEWDVRVYDAWNGTISKANVSRAGGFTAFDTALYAQDSLLLRFTPAHGERRAAPAPARRRLHARCNCQRGSRHAQRAKRAVAGYGGICI